METPAGGEEDQWSSSLSDIIVEPFEEDTGPTVAISADPTELFLSFFTPQLMEHIVVETNRFASLCLSATHRGDGPVLTWETSVDELKAYFGFQILMGFNRLPEIRDYWSTNSYFHYFPIASRISRNRFLEIQRFLHFVDNSSIASRGEPEYDRLAKVRPVIKSLQHSFFESYKPHRENAIDEAMIKFKGRSSIKQYLPKKPVKRGFKVWVRADSINGYICDFDIYTGKQDAPQKNLGANVVRKLSQPLAGGNYHLYFDNFFSTVDLFETLLDDGLYACGTFRKDRKRSQKRLLVPHKVRNACIHVQKPRENNFETHRSDDA